MPTCISCFNQSYAIFDPRKSSSFQKINCDHPDCTYFKCVNEQCVYTMKYADQSVTKGFGAHETISVIGKGEGKAIFHGALFGCSNDNHGFDEDARDGALAGVLGLSRVTISFISQLGSIIKKRFSYCLVIPLPNGEYTSSYLKFGTDMGYRRPSTQATKFINHPNNFYYLSLKDISIDNERMNFPPDTFDITVSGEGGCIIDSGSVLTYFHSDVYWKLHEKFVSYFERFQLAQLSDCPEPIQLCYFLPETFNRFPSTAFYFEDANLRIDGENVFIIDYENHFFLLAVAPHDDLVALIGSQQQRDTRFVYDLNIDLLSFVKENCSDDSA